MIKKCIGIGLATLLSFMAVGCSSKKNDESNNNFATTDVTITREDFESRGLKTATMSDTEIDFVKNGQSQYKVVVEDEASDMIVKAAKDLIYYTLKATGAEIPLIRESNVTTYASSDKYIVFGCKSIQEQANIAALDTDVGSSGYKIVQKDNSLFVQAEWNYGYSNAAYAILEYELDWQIYSKNAVSYNTTKDVKLKAFNIAEKPAIEFVNNGNKIDEDTARRMRFVSQWTMFASYNGEICHTFLKYIPQSEFGEAYPEWFSLDGKQLCLTARGDEEKLDALVEEMSQRVTQNFIAKPDAKATVIGQMDWTLECGCDACKVESTKYRSVTGAYIKFLNRISDRVAELFEEQGIEREVDLLFFAYQDSTAAPVVMNNETGKYEPIAPEVVCNDNVAVYYTPMYADYTDSFYADCNKAYRDEVAQWQAVTNKIYTFLYGTYFWNYLLPFNNFYSMTETGEFFLENGAINYFALGQHEVSQTSNFNRLKDYIESKALWNTDWEYKDIVVSFFKGQYGPAAYEMYQFFDSLTNYLEIQEEKHENIKNIWGDIDNKDYDIWRYGVLKEWEGMVEKSFKALKPIEETNPELYSTYYDNIDLEYLFIKYAYIEFCAAYFNGQELLDLKYSFKDVATRLNVTHLKEGGSLQIKYTDWGIE